MGYFRKRENTDVEELELHSDLGKSIRVTTTVTNTQSTRTGRNQPIRHGASDSEEGLKEGIKWDASMDTESIKDAGPRTVIEAGMAA
jgi:hypothetical protein